MISIILRVGLLTGIYLLVLASVRPADVAVGAALSVMIVVAERRTRTAAAGPDAPLGRRLAGVPALVGGTVVDAARGSAEVVRCCLGRPPDPGIVRIPTGPAAPASIAAWGIRLGITPNTVVVDVDEERDEVLVHVLDARDPDAVRASQASLYESRQRRVFP